MNNKNYINKDEGISNKKQNDDIYKACKYSGKMDEYIAKANELAATANIVEE